MGGFAASSLLSGAINVATIPLVVAAVGAQAWAGMAAGQAVGVIGSILIQLGWGVTGPAEIAATRNEAKRAYIYTESLYYRFAVTPPVLAAVGIISWHVVPREYSLVSCIAGVGSALLGLTASWYYVGKGDPFSLLRLDTIPRVSSVACGALILLFHPSAILFACAILLSSVLPLIMASSSIRKNSRLLPAHAKIDFSLSRAREIVSEQAPGIVSSVVSQSYKFLPLILISAILPGQAAAYALIDRIVKFAIAAIKPVAQSLQSWVPAAGEQRLLSRIWTAMALAGIAGIVAGAAFMLVGPFAAQFLGVEAIEMADWYYFPAALTIGCTALTQTGMLSLLALRRRNSVAISVSIGGFTGLALLVPAVTLLGAGGGLYSLLFAEIVVLFIQLTILVRSHHRTGQERDRVFERIEAE